MYICMCIYTNMYVNVYMYVAYVCMYTILPVTIDGIIFYTYCSYSVTFCAIPCIHSENDLLKYRFIDN